MVRVMNDRQVEWIDSAKRVLDWLADNPAFIPKSPLALYRWYWDHEYAGELTSERVDNMLEAMREGAAVLRAGAPIGSVEKIDSDSTYGVGRKFGPHSLYVAAVSSATCTMVPTEVTTEVISYDIPADVYEKYKVVKQQPVMKKVCPPITNREL